MQKKIPIACDIVYGKEIIYQCPKCKQSFNILGRTEQFCHRCGQVIDWKVLDKLPFTCPEDWENKKRIINQINKGNRSGADAHAV